MSTVDAFIALNRFGYGARPGELRRVADAPQDWLKQQLARGNTLPTRLGGYSGSAERLTAIYEQPGMDRRASQDVARAIAQTDSQDELLDRFSERVATDHPVYERLVAFWANHFTVTRDKAYLPAIIPTFEREAIRPHVFGRFANMLRAATLHPAMLIYLDNSQSVGPNSFFGKRRKRDINENLAREVLELHSLGVDGGYAQSDVEALAAALTGWTHRGASAVPTNPRVQQAFGEKVSTRSGYAYFIAPLHEPGPKKVLGKSYREDGLGQALAILDDLARHPSTAHFVATKLARHFIGDAPPEAAVKALAATFQKTNGDLGEVYRTLINRPEVWATPLPKVKSPQDYVVSVARALDLGAARRPWLTEVLPQMGQAPYSAPSPQGWPDTEGEWVAPASLLRRIEWAHVMALATDAALTPQELTENTIGPVLSPQTDALIRGAARREDAIAFILSSREFQRR